uniref:Uncharacterized protein n=1 Tax=Anguilla anguilla TaxID=7936 RepID=A0A0E9SCW6_ANGAN
MSVKLQCTLGCAQRSLKRSVGWVRRRSTALCI